MTIRLYALGYGAVFIAKGRTEPYVQYGVGSTAGENIVPCQELLRRNKLRWLAGRRGA